MERPNRKVEVAGGASLVATVTALMAAGAEVQEALAAAVLVALFSMLAAYFVPERN